MTIDNLESCSVTVPSYEDLASEILPTLPLRICDVVLPWAKRSPNQPALVESDGIWTYQQLAAVVIETREWLVDCGIRPGDRVMIICENCRALVAVLFAVTGLDAWPVTVNARLSAREIDQVRDHSGARRVIYTVNVSPHARAHGERHSAIVTAVSGLGQIGIGPLNPEAEPEPIETDPGQNIAALIYTSGTTGHPKGVMLTHRNLMFIAAVVGRLRGFTTADHVYGVLPISHVVGLSIVLLGTLLNGATLYLSPRFDPAAVLSALESDRITVIFGAPTMFALLTEYAGLKGLPVTCPALRVLHTSGAPLDAATKLSVERLFGVVLHQGYGLTECAPTIAQTRLEAPRTDTSVGRMIPGVEAKLVDLDRKPVAEGETGELWVRGPNVMKGYYKASEETAEIIDKAGWLNTGDLARLEGGNLFIVGRTRELILRFGFSVYPAEIEAVLNAHPCVKQAAVIGRPAEGGEEIVAYVSQVLGSPITTAALADYAARHLTPYKRPARIFLVPAMPMSPTGKVLKREVASVIWSREGTV
jgi:long-chain acyl-CoA synthetase